MSDSSLVPERQLVFSPGLAATIGLEEAVLLQQLALLLETGEPRLRDNHHWLVVRRERLLALLPFWSAEDLHRISRSLVDKGVLLVDSPPLHNAEALSFALAEPVNPAPAPRAESAVPSRRSAQLLPLHWAPSEDLLQLMALNHGISREFALAQLEDFIYYWRERGETSHAWENKFRQHVLGQWRRQQQPTAGFEVAPPRALDRDWQPNEDALEILSRGGIPADFVQESIPEFVLYWRERGAPPKELNSRFLQHIRIQWARYSAGLEHSAEARRISDDWQPGRDVYDILEMSHIDPAFARSLVPEFIIYWKESGQVRTSWNSKFLQHVKYHWAKRHQLQTTDTHHGGQQGSHPTGRTRDRSLADHLTDTSWAD